MFVKYLEAIVFSKLSSSGLSEGQKEDLSSIWHAIKSNIEDQSKFICAKFYEHNPECVGQFYGFGSDAVRTFIDDVLHVLGSTVEYDLRCPELFIQNPSNMSWQCFDELLKAISGHLLEQVGNQKTESLVEALEIFLTKCVSKFEEPSAINDQEL